MEQPSLVPVAGARAYHKAWVSSPASGEEQEPSKADAAKEEPEQVHRSHRNIETPEERSLRMTVVAASAAPVAAAEEQEHCKG